MNVAKQAVQCYCAVTGNPWSQFFDKLDEAMSSNADSGELWLIKRLMGTIQSHGMSVNEFKMNKDAVKGVFDEESRKKAGEFFTPEIWASEARKYFDKYIPNWHDYNVWDGSCYSMDTQLFVKHADGECEWVYYVDLKDDDLICSLNPDTSEQEWVHFVQRIERTTTEIYTFYTVQVIYYDMIDTCYENYEILTTEDSRCRSDHWDVNIPIAKVTADHNIWIVDDERSSKDVLKYKKITAKEAYDRVVEGELLELPCQAHPEVTHDGIHTYRVTAYVVNGVMQDYSSGEIIRHVDGIVKTELGTPQKVWDITLERNHIFLTRVGKKDCDVAVFCGNCGSGNLMRTANHPTDKLFLSSLQDDDITLIRNTPEYAGATAFQCDFLKDLDYDTVNTDFLNKLPPRLKEIIVNDEPLIIYMNPPYKSGVARGTDVGNHMCEIGLSKAAYDIFYQFMWRVLHFVDMFNLKNCWCGVFGPIQWFTGTSNNVLLKEFEHCFEFVDGMCLAAQEFSDTSTSIAWGIGFTLWKSRGGYIKDDFRKDILLDKKYKLPDGTLGCEGKILYEPPREKMSDWVAPKDVLFYEPAPLMTSHLTFKGSDVNEKVAKNSGRLATNALGAMMTGNTLTRGSDQSAILSMPTTIQYCSITEENFWRCVASYTFRRIYEASWAVAKKDVSAPNTKAEGYQTWLYNALVIFLFEYKSMMSSIRGVSWAGTTYDVDNKLFYLSEEVVRENCHDEVILDDLNAHLPESHFVLDRIEEAKPFWYPEIKALYDWCVQYTLFSYDKRKEVGYAGSLDCWNAGFQQIRAGLWSEEMQEEFAGLLQRARDCLRKDLDKFGFVQEIEEDI